MEMVQDVERSLSVERARSEEMQQNLFSEEMEQYRLDLERKVRVKQRQLDELEMRVEGEDEAARAIRKMHGALTDELEEATVELRRVQQGKRRRDSNASTIEGESHEPVTPSQEAAPPEEATDPLQYLDDIRREENTALLERNRALAREATRSIEGMKTQEEFRSLISREKGFLGDMAETLDSLLLGMDQQSEELRAEAQMVSPVKRQ